MERLPRACRVKTKVKAVAEITSARPSRNPTNGSWNALVGAGQW